MRKSINPLTPTQVSHYAVQAFQPHLKLRDAKHVAAQTILTVLFAAAARISSLSDTCRQLRGVPDEHVVAEALSATLPDYHRLRRRVQAALHGHLPKALRRRPQVVALDLTLLPSDGADRRTNPLVVRGKAKKGTCSFSSYGTAYPNFRSWTTKTTPTSLFSGADFPKLALQISDSFWDPQPLGKFQAQVVEQDRLRLVGTHHAAQPHGTAVGGRQDNVGALDPRELLQECG